MLKVGRSKNKKEEKRKKTFKTFKTSLVSINHEMHNQVHTISYTNNNDNVSNKDIICISFI